MTDTTQTENKCPWAGKDPLYIKYHDEEWGIPKFQDKYLFEKLCLEGFQAGLSWITILHKRESFRKAFDNFEAQKIVNYDPKKIESLLQDKTIIRNKLKIESVVNNAKAYLNLKETKTLSTFLWDFVDGRPIQNSYKTMENVPSNTKISQNISKELKKIGFKFCGPTIMYAFMQSVGMVNDHLVSCPSHHKCKLLSENSK